MSNEKIADWVEAFLVGTGKTTLPISAIESAVTKKFGLNSHDASFVVRNINQRSKTLKERYPFKIHNLAVEVRANIESIPYTALSCLAATLTDEWCRPDLDRPRGIPELFEEIACDAMIQIFGEGAQGLRFGWPSSIGRPREFNDAISWLAKKMNIKAGTSYRPPRMKDGGVDVVVWRPFADNKSGFPILLGQVTIEKEYDHKADDIDVRIWSGWLSMDVDPTVVLAVPWTGLDKEQWTRINSRALLLDRIRISSLLPKIMSEEKTYFDGCAGLIRHVQTGFVFDD